MANLSNINNVLRVSSDLRVGINTDAASYALEIGILAKEWDEGVNKAVDKHYGSKYDKMKTEVCHKFLEALIPDGKERVKLVVQTLY